MIVFDSHMLVNVEIAQSNSNRRSRVGAQGEEEEEGRSGGGRSARKRALLGQVGQHRACPSQGHCGNGWLPFLSHDALRHVELFSA